MLYLSPDDVDDDALLKQIQFTLSHGFVIAAATVNKNNVRFKELLKELRDITSRKEISRLSDNPPTELEEYIDYMRTVKETARTKLMSCVRRVWLPQSYEIGEQVYIRYQQMGICELIGEVVSVHRETNAKVLVLKLLETKNSFHLGGSGWIHILVRITDDPTAQSGLVNPYVSLTELSKEYQS